MLGDKIREARKKASLTQAELAEKIGVKRSVISKYENGSISPTHDTVLKISTALGVMPYQLYNTDDFSEDAVDSIEAISKAFSLLKFFKENSVEYPGVSELIDQVLPDFEGAYKSFPIQFFSVVSSFISKNNNNDFINSILPNIEKLNVQGRIVAQERIQELTEIPKYCKETGNASK